MSHFPPPTSSRSGSQRDEWTYAQGNATASTVDGFGYDRVMLIDRDETSSPLSYGGTSIPFSYGGMSAPSCSYPTAVVPGSRSGHPTSGGQSGGFQPHDQDNQPLTYQFHGFAGHGQEQTTWTTTPPASSADASYQIRPPYRDSDMRIASCVGHVASTISHGQTAYQQLSDSCHNSSSWYSASWDSDPSRGHGGRRWSREARQGSQGDAIVYQGPQRGQRERSASVTSVEDQEDSDSSDQAERRARSVRYLTEQDDPWSPETARRHGRNRRTGSGRTSLASRRNRFR